MSVEFCIQEDLAHNKLCCLSGAGREHSRQGNCVGAMCMAWRWVETNISDGTGGTKPSGNTHGYCGLAGAPWKRS